MIFLAARRRAPGVELVTEHPSDVGLTAVERNEAVRDHLAGCAACRIRARQLRAFVDDPAPDDAPSPTWTDPTSPPSSWPAVALGAVFDQRYLVEARIGHGGFGVVYRVRHLQLDTVHALKVLRVDGASVQDRLLREGRLQARLDHPNVVRVTDVVRVGAQLGLVMEHVAGPTLAEALARGAIRGWPERMRVAVGLVQGVAAAHRAGFVHRDLKPANVLLAEGPDGLVPRVADFGLARLLAGSEASLTRPGAVIGTPAYMAPEQFEDPRSVDARADVFAVGAILYELATGERAFAGETMAEIRAGIVGARVPPVRERAPGVPPALARAIDGALVADRHRRLAHGDAVLAVLTSGVATAPASRPWRARVLALDSRSWALGAAITLVLSSVVVWGIRGPTGTVPPAPVPAPAPAPARIAPAPAPRPPPAPIPAAPTPARIAPAPAPRPSASAPVVPSPRAPAPEPAPIEPAPIEPEPEPGVVEVIGERRPTLTLRRGDRVVSPDRVPAGRWALFADFGEGPVHAGDLTLEAGERVVVRCNGMKRQCDVAR